MKYKCNKCGNVFTPIMLQRSCPKCGNSDLEVIYEYARAQPEIAPQPE